MPSYWVLEYGPLEAFSFFFRQHDKHSLFSRVGVSSEDFTSREGYKTQMLCPSQSLADNICKKKLEESCNTAVYTET